MKGTSGRIFGHLEGVETIEGRKGEVGNDEIEGIFLKGLGKSFGRFNPGPARIDALVFERTFDQFRVPEIVFQVEDTDPVLHRPNLRRTRRPVVFH